MASTASSASAAPAAAKRAGAAGVFDELHAAACDGHVANFNRLFDRDEIARAQVQRMIDGIESDPKYKGQKINDATRAESIQSIRASLNKTFDSWATDLDRKERGAICGWRLIDASETEMNVEMTSGQKRLLVVSNGKIVDMQTR